jgi:aminoglycoside 6'-N-acetyltransferase
VAEALSGERVALRVATLADVPALVAIRREPAVAQWWGEDSEAELLAEFGERAAAADPTLLTIFWSDRVIGAIQWYENPDPQYRHAGVDLFLDPAVRGQGLGPDAVRTLIRHLIATHRFHRFVIDPSAANTAAIQCYRKCGFRPVGVLRQYESTDGKTWHDGLLMDLLADELR